VPQRSVLVSGAGIAGPALAYWLHRYGMRATVVERAPGLRRGGQTVDLRGAGRLVAQRMGLERALRAASTGEEGVRFVDGAGRTRAAIGVAAFGGDGVIAELEILRGELSALLHERTRDDTEYVFGDRVTAMTDDGRWVLASFRHRPDQAFDLVVAADGLRSPIRALAFGATTRIRPLGLYTAFFTIPRHPGDERWVRSHHAPAGRTVTLRPDNLGTTGALLSFRSGPRGYEDLEPAEQKLVLRRRFADVGWEAPRVLRELDAAPDLHLEPAAQVHMPHWSNGRVAVVGDAGYCASPISGAGTTLALVGAYVLAGELAAHVDHRDAFASYERILRPHVQQAQRLAPGAGRLTAPRTATGIRLLHAALRLAAAPGVAGLTRRIGAPAPLPLPSYVLPVSSR
jgi:2-polyprenyl-6-methoxyphenol hydroxylase-like FAD-dependent oxidoreductase